jgi:hypothetical protein
MPAGETMSTTIRRALIVGEGIWGLCQAGNDAVG